ncbi:MAG: flippase-like domain-containing protein [Anaerolineales bacterium]|nr:flippase-like domain-containing protein [Anaerolineales bacterium]
MSEWLYKQRGFLLRAAGTLLAVVLIVLLVRREGLEQISGALSQVSLRTLVLAFLLVFISRLFVSARWYVLIRSGGMKISFPKTTAVTFMGLFASNFLPTTVGGDVVRLVVIIQSGVDRAIGLASIAADRLVGMFGMACLLPFGLPAAWSAIGQNILAASFFVANFNKLKNFIRRTLQSFSIWFRKPHALLLSLACTWLHMLCIVAALYLLIQDLGSHVNFWLAAGLWSLAYFFTLFPVSINGYGLQELSLTYLFLHVGGLSAAVSLTIAIMIRLLYMAASLPGAVYIPSIFSALNQEKQDKAVSGS